MLDCARQIQRKKPGICAAKRVVSPCSVLHPPTTQIVGYGQFDPDSLEGLRSSGRQSRYF